VREGPGPPGPERKTRGHCQRNSVFGFHVTYSSRWQNYCNAWWRTVISTAIEQTRNYRSRMVPADGMSAAVKITKKGQSARPTSSSLKRLYLFPYVVSRHGLLFGKPPAEFSAQHREMRPRSDTGQTLHLTARRSLPVCPPNSGHSQRPSAFSNVPISGVCGPSIARQMGVAFAH
jgi:hypothetical protein